MENYLMVFKGTIIFTERIKEELILNDIIPIIKNESESARLAGFGSINGDYISLYVHVDQLEQSKKIIKKLRI
jgi:hypothetical protein